MRRCSYFWLIPDYLCCHHVSPEREPFSQLQLPTHPLSAPRRRVPQWRTERFGKWRPFITAAYAHTPPSQLVPHSETKREPPLHANVTQLPFNRSDKRRVGGRSDIKSKLSQVIESSHRERASARRLSRVLMGALEVEGSVFVCVIGNDNWLLISPNMFFSSATNVAAEPALRHTVINHQTFGYLPLSHARVRFPPSYFSFSPAPSLSLPYLSGAWAGKHGKWNALD